LFFGGTNELRNRSERSEVYRDFFAAPDFFFAPFFFIPGKRKERRVRNGMDKISGEELPSRDKVPAFSFCDIMSVSPLFI
jgi:hypothetical protein